MSNKLGHQNQADTLDTSYLLEIGNNNKAFVDKMLVHFKADIPKLLAELTEALTLKNAASVKEKAHKAKSVAGYLNDKDLHTLLAEIEENGATSDLSEATNSKFNEAKARFDILLSAIESYL